MSRDFDLALVAAGVGGTRFAGCVRHFPSVASTNTLALEAAQRGERAGVWVADEQTAGRGRGGHGWHSARGEGLYVSALIAPRLPASRALWIALASALAVRRAVGEMSGLDVDIRWPNDLLLGRKKCGGILVESALPAAQASQVDAMRYAVIGIGLNVAHESFPPELREQATSLRLESGHSVGREELLVALLRALDDELVMLDEEEEGAVRNGGLLERLAMASTWVRGKRVRVGEADGYTGVTAGLSAEGFLRVQADDGTERMVLSGGVRERA
jgi:BirA family biotin operon repressor/biotin-[acetyl-CoA-carboxylase] ligase